tara:strand:+ start:1643 stop:1825 length:183 start_codon:yes stop_codon:yes gene_type:complete
MDNLDKQIRKDVNSLDLAINLLLENLEDSATECNMNESLLDYVYLMQNAINEWQEDKKYI